MENLATLAFNHTRKVNKNRAMEIIQNMADGADSEKLKELAELYSYFKPATPSKPKTSSDWVCKALAKKDIRHYLQRLDVKAGKLYATDGCRVHMCSTNLEDGAYDNMLNLIDDRHAGGYPDVQRVINIHSQYTSLSSVITIRQNLGTNKHKDPTIDIKIDNVEFCFNLKYWSDLVCGFTGNAQVHFKGSLDTVYVEEGERQAVIMPIRK